MSLPLDLIADLHLSDLAAEPLWPSALIANAAHYAEAPPCDVRSPIDGALLGSYSPATVGVVQHAVEAAHGAFLKWRCVPAPQRGELVRRIGECVRLRKHALAQLITLETGKIANEAEAEVQLWINSCDFAVGLSRQLHGITMGSERAHHRLMEQWHPLGAAGLITSFNFPIGIWAWNAMTALVCGDTIVWKPSERTPLCAIAVQRLVESVVEDMAEGVPVQVCHLLLGAKETGTMLATHPLLPLISATGSVAMGKTVAQAVAGRLGRSLLLLGGNNGLIVAPSADLDRALRIIVSAVTATAGQRCTSLRRLIVHESLYAGLVKKLSAALNTIKVGHPAHEGVEMGPLIDTDAWWTMQAAIQAAEQQGGKLISGGHRIERDVPTGGYYVRPALISVPGNIPIVQEETFAPVLYVMPYTELLDAIDLHNGVSQGLSSAICTRDMIEAETFMGPAGSDCGIANVNMSTTGLEIGGAFGGEKQSGGGREAGSDAWKSYMRRVTNTICFS